MKKQLQTQWDGPPKNLYTWEDGEPDNAKLYFTANKNDKNPSEGYETTTPTYFFRIENAFTTGYIALSEEQMLELMTAFLEIRSDYYGKD